MGEDLTHGDVNVKSGTTESSLCLTQFLILPLSLLTYSVLCGDEEQLAGILFTITLQRGDGYICL